MYHCCISISFSKLIQVDVATRPLFEYLHVHRKVDNIIYCDVQFWPSRFATVVIEAVVSAEDEELSSDDDIGVNSAVILQLPAAITAQLHPSGKPCSVVLANQN